MLKLVSRVISTDLQELFLSLRTFSCLLLPYILGFWTDLNYINTLRLVVTLKRPITPTAPELLPGTTSLQRLTLHVQMTCSALTGISSSALVSASRTEGLPYPVTSHSINLPQPPAAPWKARSKQQEEFHWPKLLLTGCILCFAIRSVNTTSTSTFRLLRDLLPATNSL